jgi:hypothetical protein
LCQLLFKFYRINLSHCSSIEGNAVCILLKCRGANVAGQLDHWLKLHQDMRNGRHPICSPGSLPDPLPPSLPNKCSINSQRAAELFITLRYCIIALSIVLVLYILLLIALKFAQLSDAVRAIKSPNHLGDSTSHFSKKISSSSSGDGSRTTGPLDRSNSIKETLGKSRSENMISFIIQLNCTLPMMPAIIKNQCWMSTSTISWHQRCPHTMVFARCSHLLSGAIRCRPTRHSLSLVPSRDRSNSQSISSNFQR